MTKSFELLLISMTLAGSAVRTAQAQHLAVPDTGVVRVTATEWRPHRVAGTVQQVTADSVILRAGGSLVAVPRERVTRVEVADGKRTYVLRGFLIGTGAGLASGALLFVAACPPGTDTDCPDNAAAISLAGGAAIGMIAGSAIGGLVHAERWRDATSPPRASVGVAPASGRHGIALTVRVAAR